MLSPSPWYCVVRIVVKHSFVLKQHMISGLILQSLASLIAGFVGDVTNAGTSTGQRQKKRDKLWGTISPLTDDNGKYDLYIYIF